MDDIKRKELADGFRRLADFIEVTPEIPWFEYYIHNAVCSNASKFKAALKALGTWDKREFSHDIIGSRRSFGPVHLDVFASKSVTCERVKVGEKTIPAQAETVIPAQPESVEDVYEWKCPDSFLGMNGKER